MKFTKKYVLVPIDRYNSMKKLQGGSNIKEGSVIENIGKDLDKTPLTTHKSKSKHLLGKKSKGKQHADFHIAPAKPPPGIRNIRQKKPIEKTEHRPENSNKSFSKIKWRAL